MSESTTPPPGILIPKLIPFGLTHKRSGLLAAREFLSLRGAAGTTGPDTNTIPGVPLLQAVQGFINGLALTAFDATVSIDRRAAVLNSLLFAQLAANGDVADDPSKKLFAQALTYLPICGFSVLSQSSASYDAGGISVSLDKALLDTLKNISTSAASIDIMKDVISSLETLPDDNGALTLFDHNTINNGHATVGTTTVSEPNGSAGVLQVTFSLYDFAFSSTQTRVLWITVDDSHSKLSYSTATLALDDTKYAAVKSNLDSQLDQYRTASIANVKLKRFGT